jgi:uncharacterized protein (TIGR02145 family)
MKKVLNHFLLVCFLAAIAAFTSCKKSDIPTLTTTATSNVTTTSASTGGNITDDGGEEVTARGVCWGTTTNPLITGSKIADTKGGTGAFTSSLTGLAPNTKYYIRAYATNSEGTAYGNEVSFTTLSVTGAVLTTTAITSLTSTSAVSGGNITSDGGGNITERGVCWSTDPSPTIALTTKTNEGAGSGTFVSNITNLTPGTNYYVRAYAKNAFGVTYGNEIQFSSRPVVPTVTTTDPVPGITTATSGGNVTSDGGATVTEKGVCWVLATSAADPVSTDSHTSDGTGTGVYASSLTNLAPNTDYKVRAYATNSEGTGYGAVKTFKTNQASLPIVITAAPTALTASGVVSGGSITSSGGGNITSKGICYGKNPNPVISGDRTNDGPGAGGFTSTISGLEDGTVYYLRAYAVNEAGPAYGEQVQILTMVADIEGYLYKTVRIGNQVWMAENLRTIKYNDNTGITPVSDPDEWKILTTEAYCIYGNTPSNRQLYGVLYNWYAVEEGNLCPVGWRVASDADFQTLETTLQMDPDEVTAFGNRGIDQGAQLKNDTGWAESENGTNTSGFSALPGGFRYYGGDFWNLGSLIYFWTSTPNSATDAYQRRLDGELNTVWRERTLKQAGKYVRCVKIPQP